MPLELIRDTRETLAAADLLGVSPGGSSFPKQSTNVPPKFAGTLKWQTWDTATYSHLVDKKLRNHLRIYINNDGKITNQPSVLLTYQTTFGQNNDLLIRWPLDVDPDIVVIAHYSIRYVVAPSQILDVDIVPWFTGHRITVYLECDVAGQSVTTVTQLKDFLADAAPYLTTSHPNGSNRTGVVPAMDWIVFQSAVTEGSIYDPLFLCLKWEGIYLNCWTKWKITMQHSKLGTNIPAVTELPYFTNSIMTQSPVFTEAESLYADTTQPIYVPRYWGQQPRPWTGSATGELSMQPPQFYDCRRYLFANFLLRTYMYVPDTEQTGDPWHDMAWPRWIKQKNTDCPEDTLLLARCDPTEPTTLPPHMWYKGGGRFEILPCIIEIEGTVYPNKFLKGPILGTSKAKLEIINVDSP